MDKVKFELEFEMKCSTKVLYNRLSTASGLSEWFADDVQVNGKKFNFIWDGYAQPAEIAFKKENMIVRFNWLEDDDYFEFKIVTDELTNDISLIVTDFAEEDEIDESKSLWDSQIATLKHIIGA